MNVTIERGKLFLLFCIYVLKQSLDAWLPNLFQHVLFLLLKKI